MSAALSASFSGFTVIAGSIGGGTFENGNWWTKFTLDLDDPQAWNVVQELGYVLNYLSLEERLPTIFMPVSPPPYANGPAREFLSWVIESRDPSLHLRFAFSGWRVVCPNPVDDLTQWPSTSDEET